MTTAAIPNRPVFRAQEVCEIAQVQSYVLRSWEAEFPDLGVAKTAGGARIYRRADVERVLRIKHLLLVDGLTLAGARKRLGVEAAAPSDDIVNDADLAALVNQETRQHLHDVRRGLQWILGVLSGDGVTDADRVLAAQPAAVRSVTKASPKVAPRRGKTAAKAPARALGAKKR